MTLITILLVLFLEHHLGSLERLRSMRWLSSIQHWVKGVSLRLSWFDGLLGVLIIVLLPCVLFAYLDYNLQIESPVLAFILGFIVVIYCIGPDDLDNQIAAYQQALKDDPDTAGELAAAFVYEDVLLDQAPDEPHEPSGACLVAANDRLFAILFWFSLLGPAGCLGFRICSQLRHRPATELSGLSAYVRSLYDVLNWAPARATALGYALSGSLTHALDAWRFRDTIALHHNEAVIKHAGLGSLLLEEQSGKPMSERLELVQGLIKRTLMVFLVVLALVTLSGRLG